MVRMFYFSRPFFVWTKSILINFIFMQWHLLRWPAVLVSKEWASSVLENVCASIIIVTVMMKLFVTYTEWMFSAFKVLLCSLAQPIKISYAGLLLSTSCRNMLLPQCMQCSNIQEWRYGIKHWMKEKRKKWKKNTCLKWECIMVVVWDSITVQWHWTVSLCIHAHIQLALRAWYSYLRVDQ